MPSSLELIPLSGLPLVEPGDDLAHLIATTISASGLSLLEGDIVVIAQKVVSKSEGRYAHLNRVIVSDRARSG